MRQFKFALMSALLCANSVLAADIAGDIRKASNSPNTSNGGYFELGLHLRYLDDSRLLTQKSKDEIQINGDIAGGYRYRGFFIEASHGSLDGLSLGYNVWNSDRWAIDLLGSSLKGKITTDDNKIDNSTLPEAQRDQALLDRDTLYNGAGIRATAYFGNTIFQYRLVSDIHDGNGITSTARLGYSWQLKNWNFHSVISADYASVETSRYWHGVTEKESTTRFPKYDLSSTLSYVGEVGLSYPINEHVVFRSTARYTQFSDAIEKSPLATGNDATSISTSISYVF